MQQQTENNEPQQPKNSIDFHFAKAKERALLSPLIKSGTVDLKNFVDFYEFNNNYQIVLGLLVVYVDSSHYKHDLGAFYPYWTLQGAFISKASRMPVKLNLLTGKQREALSNAASRIMKGIGDQTKITKQHTASDLEWRLPFTETDILMLDKVFQDIIRRKQ